MAHHERAAEIRFHHIAEEQSEHKGSRREIIYFAYKTEQRRGKHNDDVEKIIIQRIGSDNAQKTYRRPNGRLRNIQHFCGRFCGNEAEDQKDDVRKQHEQHNLCGKIGIFRKHFQAGLHTVHRQRADKDRGNRISGNAERHHRCHRPSDNRIICSRRNGKPFKRALSVFFGMLTHFFCIAPRDNRCDVAARRGNRTDYRSFDGTDKRRYRELFKFLKRRQNAAERKIDFPSFHFRRFFRAVSRIHLIQNFTDTEHADHNGNKRNAGEQIDGAESKARYGKQRIKSYAAEQDARNAEYRTFEHVAGGYRDHHRKTEKREHTVFGRIERYGEIRDRRGKQNKAQR